MRSRRAALTTLALVLASALDVGGPAAGGALAPVTECTIENQTPSLPLGAEARYVVQLSGGSGTYAVRFGYGDGGVDSLTVSGTQAIFAHWFQTRGTFTQTARVDSMGSSATCTSQTTVW